ncbi:MULTISPECIES: aminodeoxychorismate synthase component I [unclassified Rhodanobacter]|uniref:aminodeoxychorismate synthase component I n=1 Tax=unclassified Rhodanobacter TaxID=2621553 RepID=UPI001BDE072A|nr:aminodeoxychorismate synthase component I [Rhodanobacter sp. LX-99]MBT2148161.1 aminodeoxychorismate synthase component I [Rhodanobacter sp. LX-100]
MTCHRRILDGRRDLLAPAAAFPQRYPCLLESVVHGTAQSRYDILFAFPRERLTLHADGCLRDDAGVVRQGRFLDALDAAWRAERLPPEGDGLPFHGGWVLLLAYELAGEIEPTLKLRPPTTLPLALAVRCPAAVIVDHVRDCTILVAEAGHEDLLDVLEADLAIVSPIPPLAAPVDWDEDAPQQFLDGVARIHEHLYAGDIFQVNLSRAWRARYAQPPVPASLYAVLRQANPAPFAGLLQQPGWAVASSSPERLVEVRGGVAQTRPIAGTRPRLPGDDELARIRELSAHPKERAEHVMLIDLERNDLGRVCMPGSVEVDELMVVESYAHVHHIVSNVRGRLRADVTPGEVIAATFPGGTITGCPKVRCMEIIAALEDAPRGAYTGALGYLDRNGELDLNILIRTLTLAGDEVSLRAGAGIVADSVAANELDETRAKARGLLRALGVPD